MRAAIMRAIIGSLGLCSLLGCRMFSANVDSDSRSSPLHVTAPPPWSGPRDVTVVTYNVKDMWWLTDHRKERMREIGWRLAMHNPDVVCLQEGFVAGDIDEIVEAMEESGPLHVRDFPSGALGSGLWILSRHPIVEAYFLQFTHNGHWWEFRQGDWWAGKGMGLARIELAPDTYLDVYNTHFIAPYAGDSNLGDRFSQAGESLRFIRRSTPHSIPALVLGDINSGSGGDAYRALTGLLGLQHLHGAWVDHIFGYDAGGGYTFELLKARESISGTVDVGDRKASLSDHSGNVASVRISRPGFPRGPRNP